ncbi:MAG: hypothetical protein PVI86_12300, partial [Phycisphaerae bacterium]
NGSANYYGSNWAIGAPYYRTEVGAYDAKPSDSPYATFDQGGNVWEWNEAVLYDSSRGVRGGSFHVNDVSDLHAANRYYSGFPALESHYIGFRVAEVSEPGPDIPAVSEWGVVTMALLVLTAGTLVWARRGAAIA